MAGPHIDLSGHLGAEQLSALVDDTADGAARSHLSGCGECRDRLAAWRMVHERVAALDDDRAQRMLDARRKDIVEAVTAGAPGPGRRRLWRLWRLFAWPGGARRRSRVGR